MLILVIGFFLKFSWLIFKWETKLFWVFCGQTLFQALYLEIEPLKSTLAPLGENPKIAITKKALDRIL